MNRKANHNLAWELVTVLKTDFFHRWKLQEKSTFVHTDFFTRLIMYCYAKQC